MFPIDIFWNIEASKIGNKIFLIFMNSLDYGAQKTEQNRTIKQDIQLLKFSINPDWVVIALYLCNWDLLDLVFDTKSGPISKKRSTKKDRKGQYIIYSEKNRSQRTQKAQFL